MNKLRRWIGVKMLKPWIKAVWKMASEGNLDSKDAILLITGDHVSGNNRDIYD